MIRLDEEQLFRDDLAERRRERDREREPARVRASRLPGRELRTRQAFQARQVDLVNVALDTTITALECPACLGPVFAPACSSADRIDCVNCDARLVTVQTSDGVAAVLLPGGDR